jgi:hypothetical protein
MKKITAYISSIITPTFASETQTFSRKAFRPLFFRENHTEKNHVLGMRSSNNILFLRLNSNF